MLPSIECLLFGGHCTKWWRESSKHNRVSAWICFPHCTFPPSEPSGSLWTEQAPPSTITESLGEGQGSPLLTSCPDDSCAGELKAPRNSTDKATMAGQSWARSTVGATTERLTFGGARRILGGDGLWWGLRGWLFAHIEGMEGRTFQAKEESKSRYRDRKEQGNLKRLDHNCERGLL